MIDLEGVSRSFGDTDVLSAVDLSVSRGELVGLVGPNGAGKTTLLRTVNGLLDPDDGTVQVDGDDVTALGAQELGRRVATVPQDTHVAFEFTVEAVVEMGRTPHRSRLDWTDATTAVSRALERTETSHLADRSVGEISGGERQRVLLARALAQEAPALLLDEPTASLDVNHQVRVLELVRGLVDDGRTALAAIHDLELAARYCDRLAVLADGEILAAGPPETVLTAGTVERAFGTAVAVGEDAITATPRVTAVGRRPDRDGHVHVAGGGRTGARVLGACWRAGFDATVGVVPEGDATAALAADLGVEAVSAPAFESVDGAVRASLEAAVDRADVIVAVVEDGPWSETLPQADVFVEAEAPVVQWTNEADGLAAVSDSTRPPDEDPVNADAPNDGQDSNPDRSEADASGVDGQPGSPGPAAGRTDGDVVEAVIAELSRASLTEE